MLNFKSFPLSFFLSFLFVLRIEPRASCLERELYIVELDPSTATPQVCAHTLVCVSE